MSFANLLPSDGKSWDGQGLFCGPRAQRGETNKDHLGGYRDALKKFSLDSSGARTNFRPFSKATGRAKNF